ncbi:MAG: hypothetical protein K2K03_02600, partial [Prevotella sp.]|nr:hypothetical protein [Prevotella sp.]
MIIPDNARYFPFFCGAKRGGVSCEVSPYMVRSVSGHDAECVGIRCGCGRRMVRNVPVHGVTFVGAVLAPAIMGAMKPPPYIVVPRGVLNM